MKGGAVLTEKVIAKVVGKAESAVITTGKVPAYVEEPPFNLPWIFGAIRMIDKYQLKIVVASDIDYENLIAEIYCDGEFIALLQQEDGEDNIKVEFSSNARAIDFDWFQYALSEARKTLLNK